MTTTNIPRAAHTVDGKKQSAVPAIALEEVTIRYGDQIAVDNVSLEVEEGELVTLLGPSGSGKTSLLNLVAGAFAPDKGRVLIRGKDVSQTPPNQRNAGMVFQSYTLFPGKTIAKNVAFPLQIRKVPKPEVERRVQAALEMVHLDRFADKLPSQISGGQAQRVALARAIVFNPEIMLFDEPLGALDRALRKQLQLEIRNVQRSVNVPALYVTHDQEEAMGMSDRIVLFRDGHIVQQGAPREVYQNPVSVWSATFLGEANVWPIDWSMQDASGCIQVNSCGFEFTVTPGEHDVIDGAKFVVSRPEDCLVRIEPDPENRSYEGVVKDVEYLGAIQRIQIDMPTGHRLQAVTPGRDSRWAVGDRVFCSWREGSQRLLAQ